MKNNKKKILALALAADFMLIGNGCSAKHTDKVVENIDSSTKGYVEEIVKKQQEFNYEFYQSIDSSSFDIPSGYTKVDDFAYITWDEANVYSDRYITNQIATIKGYEVVKRLATMDSDSYVELSDGTKGFILNKCLNVINDNTFICIDLDRDNNGLSDLNVYKNGALSYSTKVRLGNPADTPSVPGAYPIVKEFPNGAKFTGSYGSCFVDKAIQFSNIYYIHTGDLSSDSHGCVRTNNETMDYILENTDPNQLVLIHK